MAHRCEQFSYFVRAFMLCMYKLTVTAAVFYNTRETICIAVQLINQYAKENIL